MRRRDPVKRAIWAGGGLVALVLLWIVSLQMKINAAKTDLKSLEGNLTRIEEATRQAQEDKRLLDDSEKKLLALDRYATNRFLWANTLNALQELPMENLRLTEIDAKQRYVTNAPLKFSTVNVTVPYTPPPAFWNFWAPRPAAGAVDAMAASQFKSLTNKPPFTTNKLAFTTKMTRVSTNVDGTLTVKVESSTVQAVAEEISMSLAGRDYGNPAGPSVEKLTGSITNNVFFASRLSRVEGRALELKPLPTTPLPDFDSPTGATYVPFNFVLRFEERYFSNE